VYIVEYKFRFRKLDNEGKVTFSYSELVMILLLVGFLLYWSSAQQIREIALRTAKAYCQKMDVQMLDGYVALNALWLKRDKYGKIRVWRSYLFEFTATGQDRYNGKVIMLGKVIESVQLETHRI
jgi:hypothetical protein